MSSGTPSGRTSEDRLPTGAILAYSYPTAGAAFVSFLLGLYLFKFSTDVLLIAPAAMGLIFALARIWDAVSDPMAGYLSDRTQTRLGRRRPWLLASALPIAVVPVMVWSPPAFLEGASLIAWMTVGILAYETVLTIFFVPHAALGAELSMDHHERTRVFAFRHVAWSIGFLACVGAVHLLITSEDKRATAVLLASAGGGVSALFILYGVVRLREHPEHLGRGGERPFRAFADVLRNPHARLLVFVFLIESLGTATLGIMSPYFFQYVLQAEWAYAPHLLFHFVPTLLVIPVGVALSRRFGKKKLWAISMAISGLAYLSVFLAGPGDVAYVFVCVAFTGIGSGIGAIVGPSIQADLIDYDEYTTGERKEGAYFAVWNFVRKAAGGITGGLAGVALQYVGFAPNLEQTEATQLTIRVLYSVLPGVSMIVGVAIFSLRFRLTEGEHQRIRAELDARAEAAISSGASAYTAEGQRGRSTDA